MEVQNKPFLLTEHLARRWHMSARTLERWRHEGKGPAWFVIGGRILYSLRNVEVFEVEGIRDPHAGKSKPKPRS